MTNSLVDEEKGAKSPSVTEPMPSEPSSPTKPSNNAFGRLNERLTALNVFESRGIERVPEEDRQVMTASDYMQMALLWFSTNITANNMAIGMFGPTKFGLGFVDSALCATFGALLGAAGVAYMGTFGPQSGNRTLVRLC